MGLFSKLIGKEPKAAGPKKRKSVTEVDGWEVWLRDDGTPYTFEKKGKEWLSTDRTWVSPSGKFFLHVGSDGNGDDCVALTTRVEGLKLKKVEDGVEAVTVTDNGTAYVLTDAGDLLTITTEKTGQRHLCDDLPDEYVLDADICAVAFESDSEEVMVKCVELKAGRSWQKKIKYQWPESGGNVDIAVNRTNTGIVVTTPDGTLHAFSLEGSAE